MSAGNAIHKPPPEKMQDMIEQVHMDLVHLQSQLRSAYGIEPAELNLAVSNTSKMLQMTNAAYSGSAQLGRASEAPLMLPTPPDRPQFLSGRPKKLTQYQPLFKNADILALASNPESSESRRLLADRWGVQLPVLVPYAEDEEEYTAEKRKPVSGLVLANVPVNSKAASFKRTGENSLKNGLLAATQRGVIPKASKIVIKPQPVQPLNLFQLHASLPQPEPTVKAPLPTKQSNSKASVTFAQPPPNTRQPTLTTSGTNREGFPPPPPASPAPNVPIIRTQEKRLAIQHGLARVGPELERLRERSETSWPHVRAVLDAFELLFQNFAVPLAFVNTEKLPELAAQLNAGVAITKEQIVDAIVNRTEVEELLKMPGRRYMGRNGTLAAAIAVQSWWRGTAERKRYQAWRAAKLRTALVALHWLMNAKLARIRRLLQQSRADHLESYRTRLSALAAAWPRMKNRRRLVIHLPSLGLTQPVRNSMGPLVSRLEHAQMGRLCDIRDPLVDSIYLSPVRLSPDDTQYMSKLLALLSAVKTGCSSDARPADSRYAVVVPETIGRFPTHYLQNAATVKYSARALSRLRALIAGRDAYIVPWHVSWDDLAVAAELGLPILGPEPDVARVYGCKSGAHRLLVAASVELPPGQADLHSAEQVAESLSRLLAANVEYKIWLLKIDNERNGRGTAVIDLTDFVPAKRLARERARYGDEWFLGWSQEAAAQKMQAELQTDNILETLIKPNCPWVFEDGATFLKALSETGGLLEAASPSRSTSVSVDLLVEPDGNFQIVSSGDQFTLDSHKFSRIGATMPQTSMESAVLNDRCKKIAETCRDRGVIGYISIDFVVLPQTPPSIQALQLFRQHSGPLRKETTTVSTENSFQREDFAPNLWITGLKLGYSTQLAMMQMFLFLTEGTFFPERHRVESVLIPEIAKRRLVQPPPKPKQRFAAYAYPLRNTGLKSVSRAVFFQLCRAHGIGYDVRERCGTAFLLNDSACREELSMMCIADNLPDVVSGAIRNLKTLNSELAVPKPSSTSSSSALCTSKPNSSSSMSTHKLPGFTIDLPDNFITIADELEQILHTVFANEQMQLEEEALREAQSAQEVLARKREMTDLEVPVTETTEQ